MWRVINFTMAGVLFAGSVLAQDSGVKTYQAPEIDVGVEAIGREGKGHDGDVFLGVEQGVLRRRIAALEARIEILEGVIVQLHGPEVKAHLDKMMLKYESNSSPVPATETDDIDGRVNGDGGG